jgi:DUF917 family protein
VTRPTGGAQAAYLSAADIPDIARGAAILGAGGGGDPWLGSLMAQAALADCGPVPLVTPDQVPDDAFVLPVAIMGAPTVIVEKPPAGDELLRAFAAVQRATGREVTHVACLEAGGLNSMTPIVTAARAGLPLIDGDGMGRAFPELQMVLFTLDGISSSPMAMADEKGNTIVLDTIDNAWSERLARSATVDMGCSASIALYPLTGAQARRGLVPGTLSLARDLGRLVRDTRAAHGDPAQALAQRCGGAVLVRGKILDVQRRTDAGFARGSATVLGVGPDQGRTVELAFQNEHLVATEGDGRVLASVPDLICVVDTDTGEPVTTEGMRYGFRVTVLALPAHERWRTPEGLALVGPRYFGYDHDFVPIGR